MVGGKNSEIYLIGDWKWKYTAIIVVAKFAGIVLRVSQFVIDMVEGNGSVGFKKRFVRQCCLVFGSVRMVSWLVTNEIVVSIKLCYISAQDCWYFIKATFHIIWFYVNPHSLYHLCILNDSYRFIITWITRTNWSITALHYAQLICFLFQSAFPYTRFKYN